MAEQAYPCTEEGVAAALASLGDTADLVATSLTAGGHRGEMDVCTACPVAHFLLAVVEGIDSVEVGDASVRAFSWADDLYGVPEKWETRVETPDAVGDFIHAFDLGEYEELIEEASNG